MHFLEKAGLYRSRLPRVPFAVANACFRWLTRFEQTLGKVCRFPIGNSLFAILRVGGPEAECGSDGSSGEESLPAVTGSRGRGGCGDGEGDEDVAHTSERTDYHAD